MKEILRFKLQQCQSQLVKTDDPINLYWHNEAWPPAKLSMSASLSPYQYSLLTVSSSCRSLLVSRNVMTSFPQIIITLKFNIRYHWKMNEYKYSLSKILSLNLILFKSNEEFIECIETDSMNHIPSRCHRNQCSEVKNTHLGPYPTTCAKG